MKYSIGSMPQPVDPAFASRLLEVEVATVGHFRFRGFVDRSIRPLQPGRRVVGTAVTVAIPGPDSTLLHHAVGLLQAGHVLVIDRLGDDRHACLGGGVARAVAIAGASGAILDGPCTDPDEIVDVGLPVWCCGVSGITTRLLNLGGSLNEPIACGNVPVLPGDIVLADESGVLVLPPHEVAAVAEEALARQQRAMSRQPRILGGEKLGDVSGASRMVQEAMEAQDAR
jgi:4-hydroxy-4-methyl-2-oxoglutarate aldolase